MTAIDPTPTPDREQHAKRSLYTRQLELELEQSEAGAQLVRMEIERSRDKKSLAHTSPGRKLVDAAIVPLAKAIERELSEYKTGRPGVSRSRGPGGSRHAFVVCLENSDPYAVASIAATKIVNVAALGDAPRTGTARGIGGTVEQSLRLHELPRAYRDAISKQLNKDGATSRHRHRVFNHVLNKHGVGGEWSSNQRLHVGQILIALFEEATGWIEYDRPYRGKGSRPNVIKARPEFAETFKKLSQLAEFHNPYLMPMLVPPRPWTSRQRGGYLSRISGEPFGLVGGRGKAKTKGSGDNIKRVRVNLKAARQAVNGARQRGEIDVVLDAVNVVQSTPWKINRRVLDVARHLYDTNSLLGREAGLPRCDQHPLPAKVDSETWANLSEKARKEKKADRKAVYKAEQEDRKHRRTVGQLLNFLGPKFADASEIYFPCRLDWRGRLYYAPSHLDPQGSDLSRALLTFAHGKPINSPEAAQWLLRHGQNLLGDGGEKGPLWTRHLDAFDEQFNRDVRAIAAVPDGPYVHTWWVEAKEPWQFLAWCFEWAAYLEHGLGYVSHLPVMMDGSCNGIQHLAVLARDAETARLVNLAPGNRGTTPADIYREVRDEVVLRLRRDSTNKYALLWKQYGGGSQWDGIDRALIKPSVMTLPYGSRYSGMRDQIKNEIRQRWKKGEMEPPTEIDSEMMREAITYLANHINRTRKHFLAKELHVQKWLSSHAKLMTDVDAPVMWTTPTGFPVRQEYRTMVSKRVGTTWPRAMKGRIGKPKGSDVTSTVWDMTDNIDGSSQRSGIAANFVHSLDAAHLHRIAQFCGQSDQALCLVTVHDAFGTHAADADRLQDIILAEFAEIHIHDPLLSFRAELQQQHPDPAAVQWPEMPYQDHKDIDLAAVMDAIYAFSA